MRYNGTMAVGVLMLYRELIEGYSDAGIAEIHATTVL